MCSVVIPTLSITLQRKSIIRCRSNCIVDDCSIEDYNSVIERRLGVCIHLRSLGLKKRYSYVKALVPGITNQSGDVFIEGVYR